MDIEKLLKSLDNETNTNIINMSNEQIINMKKTILNELNISKEENDSILNKLNEYMYVDELNDFKYGTYLRWIKLTNNTISLATGGIFCEIQMKDNGVNIICKNFRNKHFSLNLDEYIIFRKLTDQEQTILYALQYIHL